MTNGFVVFQWAYINISQYIYIFSMSCMELKHVFFNIMLMICFNAIFIDTVDGFYILYGNGTYDGDIFFSPLEF